MAGNAVVGALRVDLGLDSAQFEAGLKKAQSGLAGFGKAAAIGLAAVAVAGAAAGLALSKAMGGAINRFDDMGKAAQKVGVTVEALSQLEYAARLSDVSLEQLTGGLQRLSRSMADVAGGSKGPAASAFTALGISVTDATGKLRASNEVFADVAEKLAHMENGSTKTALAIAIFGRAGAEMIPLLNSGRAGLKEMADEAGRLGISISDSAARNAEQFNDNLTRVSARLEGVVNIITGAALPVFTYLSDKFVEATGNGEDLEAFAKGFTDTLKFLVTVGAITVTSLRAVGEAFSTLMSAGMVAQTGFQNWGIAAKILENGFTSLGAEIDATTEFVKGLWAAVDEGGSGGAGGGFSGGAISFGGAGGASAKAAEAMAARLEALRQSLMTEEQLEIDSHNKRLAEIQKFYENGMILRGEYDTMLQTAQQQHAERMNEIARWQVEEEMRLRETLVRNVSSIFGSLSTLAENFGDKNLGIAKGFAVAEAIINTAQGITKALAQGGMLGFAGAAAVAASGAAQISTILSTQKGSGSKPSVSGSGSGAAIAGTPAGAPQGTSVNVTLKGGGLYSRDNIEELFTAINGALGDGFKLNLQEQ